MPNYLPRERWWMKAMASFGGQATAGKPRRIDPAISRKRAANAARARWGLPPLDPRLEYEENGWRYVDAEHV